MTDIVGTDTVKDALLTKANAAIGSVDDAESGFTDLDTRLDAIDALLAAVSDDGFYSACTSSTRPAFASINHGHLIGETDTGNFYLADKTGTIGTAARWVVINNANSYLSAGLPTTGTTYTVMKGTRAKEVTSGTVIAPTTWVTVEYNGSTWEDVDDLENALLFGGM